MYAKVSITNFTKKANCLIIELWHERTKKAKAELNPHRTPIQMSLTRTSKDLIEIYMRSNFAMKFSALLQMVETLILISSKSYFDIIDQKYNIFQRIWISVGKCRRFLSAEELFNYIRSKRWWHYKHNTGRYLQSRSSIGSGHLKLRDVQTQLAPAKDSQKWWQRMGGWSSNA